MLYIAIAIFIMVMVQSVFFGFLFKHLMNTQDGFNKMISFMSMKLDGIEKSVKQKGSVTDPFEAANRSNAPGASGKHIIVRKTPDQIRSENYQKLKEGAAYGHAD